MSTDAIQPTCPHTVLIWIMRGTGALVAGASAIVTVYVPCEVVIHAIQGYKPSGWFGVLIAVPFVAGVFGFISKRGYDIFQKMNAVTVADFSGIVALLLAGGWHYFLPPHLPKGIAAYCARNPFLVPFAEQSPGYRYWLSLIVFIVFYKLIKAYLMQMLNLNTPTSPQNPDQSTSSDPSAPFVPFDPYNLSNNPPTALLRSSHQNPL